MNGPEDVERGIREYLGAVEEQLGAERVEARTEIVRSLENHIYEALRARAGERPTRGDLEAVLAEMDPPESYGEAQREQDDPDAAPAASPRSGRPGSRAWFLLALAFLILNGWAVWHGVWFRSTASGRVVVASFSAARQAAVSGTQPLNWTFSHEMVEPEQVGRPLPAAPAEIIPAVEGTFVWETPQRLVFTPQSAWPVGQLYEMAFSDALASAEGRALSGDRLFRFQTEPLQWLAVEQVDLTPQRELTLRLVFNAAPDASTLAAKLHIHATSQAHIGYRLLGEVDSAVILLRTDSVQNETVTLDLDAGLPARHGPLGLPSAQSRTVAISDTLQFRKLVPLSPAFGPCTVQAFFSAPIDPESAATLIAVQPAVAFQVGALNFWEGGGCALSGAFEPGQVYTITFRPGLKSLNGTTLTREVSRTAILPNRPPSLAIPVEGRYLSPRGKLQVPLNGVNLRACEVRLRPVLPHNLVFMAMRESGRYNRFYGYQDADYTDRLTGTSRVQELDMAGALNEEVRRMVDLRALQGGVPSGAYLLTAFSKLTGETSRLVVVTDLGISARRARDGVLVWVNSLRAAQPSAGAEVTLFAENGEQLGRGATGADGLVFIPCAPGREEAPPFMITARQGDDLSYLALDGAGAQAVGFPQGRPYLIEGFEACVFPDRGIYRPGETVHAKALLRDRQLDAPREAFPVLLRLRQPDGRVFSERSAVLDALGAVEGEWAIPHYAPTGLYTIEAVLPGASTVLGLTRVAVEDFVPPQIAVEVTPPAGRVSAVAPSFTMRVSARHLFGRPASDLPVQARVTMEPAAFESPLWPGWQFGDQEKTFTSRNVELGTGRLDQDGVATFTVALDAGWRPPSAMQAVFGATVTETSGRAVSAYASVPIDLYPWYIGLLVGRESGALRVGDTRRVELAAVRPDGTLVTNAPALQVTLARAEWVSYLKRQGDGRYAYASERRLMTEREDVVPMDQGRGAWSFAPARAGSYVLTVRDPLCGTSSSVSLYAASPEQSWVHWAAEAPDRVALALDRDRYRPGEEARLLIKAPFAGTALLTVESDRILERRVLTLDGNTLEVVLPVTADFAPNVYCSVTLIRPAVAESVWSAHRALGSIALQVDRPERRLKVEVEAPDVMRPQSKLTARLRVLDAQGAPVQGEVVVAAVDEAICMLTQFETPDPLGYFLSPRRLGVALFDLYSLLMPEFPEALDGAASHTAGGEGAMLRRRLNPIRASRFKPVALWVSGVATDTNGMAEVSFDVPEFTGALRLMAVAYSRTQAGSAARAVTVKRPLVVQAGLPRFLAPGDTCRIPVAIFNETGKAIEADLRVTCGGPLSVAQPEQRLALAAGARATALVELQAGRLPGKGVCTLEVVGGGERHAETIELPVRPAAAPTTQAFFGTVEPGEELRLAAPAGWIPETLHGELWASAQPEVQWGGGLDYLLRYPYGCLEQTVSASFPLLYLADLVNRTQPRALDRLEVGAYVTSGLYRMLSMQLALGGFAAWPRQNDLYTWGSCYAAHFLVEAKRAGYDVPADRLDAALDWLRARLDQRLPVQDESDTSAAAAWRADMEERAYACHVLALADRPEHGWMARLQEQAPRLSFSAQTHLAAALMRAGKPKDASTLLTQIGMPSAAPYRDIGGSLNSDIRDLALVLSAWLDLDPAHAAVPPLVQRLQATQKEGRWATTQDNALALMALGKYAQRVPADRQPFEAALVRAAGARLPFDDKKLFRWSSPEPGSDRVLRLENKGPGRVYYGAVLEGVPAVDAVEEGDWGLTVRRTLLMLNGSEVGERPLRQGEVVVVRLTLSTLGRAVDNLVITELLPAGLEIENPALLTSQAVPWIKDKTDGCAHRDLRDDRLLLFTGWLNGEYSFYYAARAVTAGTFVYPAATAEAMYDPAVRSVHGRAGLTVQEMDDASH